LFPGLEGGTEEHGEQWSGRHEFGLDPRFDGLFNFGDRPSFKNWFDAVIAPDRMIHSTPLLIRRPSVNPSMCEPYSYPLV
jgi:hypothetical protein